MTARTARLVVLAIALATAGCDQATKRWAEEELRDAPPTTLVAGRLDLTYVENPGIAFGLDRVAPPGIRKPVIVSAAIAALAVLGLAWYRRGGAVSAQTVAGALIAGGAAGNLIDRFARGAVVDFVHLHGWPVFNVADVALVAGVALLLVAEWRRGRAGPVAPTS
jgi:signal peptidase II